jgi:hypothetical protein
VRPPSVTYNDAIGRSDRIVNFICTLQHSVTLSVDLYASSRNAWIDASSANTKISPGLCPLRANSIPQSQESCLSQLLKLQQEDWSESQSWRFAAVKQTARTFQLQYIR